MRMSLFFKIKLLKKYAYITLYRIYAMHKTEILVSFLKHLSYIGKVGFRLALFIGILGIYFCSEHKAVRPVSEEVCPESDRDFFKRKVWGPILQYKGCQGCHNESGIAKVFGVRWHLTQNDADQDFETMKAVAQRKAGEISLLKRKVINDPVTPHKGGNLFPDIGPEGKDVALLQILDEFIARAQNPTPECSRAGINYDLLYGVQEYDFAQTLRKARIALTGKIPTVFEENLVSEKGSRGFDEALNLIMQDPDFYERLREIWNDILHTDKYFIDPLIGNYMQAYTVLDQRLYPERNWFETFPAQGYPLSITTNPTAMAALRQELATLTNKSLAREPLELIVFIVKNNRPFTEIVTAPYIMVNAYSARSYGINQVGVPVFSDSSYISDHPYENFVPAKLKQREVRLSGWMLNTETVDQTKQIEVPLAGILTSPIWLARYPTAEGNANRHRSRMVFEFFLDLNLLTLAQQLEAFGDQDPNPTLNDPNCAVCHTIMDPVAGLFKNYRRGNYYIQDSWYHDPAWLRFTPNTRMRPPGYSVEEPLPPAFEQRPLVWLGQRLARDPRFSLSITKHMFKALTGRSPLKRPSENDRPAGKTDSEWQQIYRELEQAYLLQERDIERFQRAFEESNFNLKVLIKEIIKSPYFRAKNAKQTEEYRLRHVGVARLLTPEQLDKKIESVTGIRWVTQWSNIPYLLRDYYFLYGGIDSINTTVRTQVPNGLMSNIQLRMALQIACQAVVRDFSHINHSDRKLLPLVEPTYAPEVNGVSSPTAIEKIKQNIRYLHRQILGEFLSLQDPEIERTYQLFYLTFKEGWSKKGTAQDWDTGNPATRAPLRCTFNGLDAQGNPIPGRRAITSDPNYVIRAWQATVAYLLTDARFVYE